ncbi:iron ABC transporter permease [Corynebacterium sp.]|uniref:FecCD family ABC transporter permease n=1 Tax=Corynebacterium sp. TaxID=1720 RepID=UPI0026E0810E|nr:iron ABC transporter permease [Corynebacterium sp.]MDO5511624.1 iron ABC transporter permease [Corynebacterium sp.]
MAALTLSVVASVAFGARDIDAAAAWAALLGHTETIDQAAATQRLPRTALAVLVGAALAIAGTSMQAITRNPLADPGIFGVLSGAALAVVIGIAFFGLSATVPTFLVSILGSAVAAVFVYVVGSLSSPGGWRGGGPSPMTLALAGAATAAAASSLVSAVLLPRVEVMDTFRFWQIGSVGGASFDHLSLGIPFLLVGTLLCVISAGGLNALALGDDIAAGLGTHPAVTRLLAALGAVILCGTATALAGPIGFVGLIVPHLCRLIVGTDHRWLLPASALAGAVLLVGADTVGRVIARPSEIAVAILTPVLGAPLFIWIVRRQKVRDL